MSTPSPASPASLSLRPIPSQRAPTPSEKVGIVGAGDHGSGVALSTAVAIRDFDALRIIHGLVLDISEPGGVGLDHEVGVEARVEGPALGEDAVLAGLVDRLVLHVELGALVHRLHLDDQGLPAFRPGVPALEAPDLAGDLGLLARPLRLVLELDLFVLVNFVDGGKVSLYGMQKG